ncbi:MAG: tyrosine recombinase XerC [Chromatiales bacterium]|jgi:integrase/recombinase XerC|nr:tyrosine recombinase XerC [Chromatiales bacterium]MDH3893593.1 tyrosine recombinase XerC [Chromatiales bacterium]MDH4013070.1 tyrosine recombinase XerC [Chromatiales bacterium]PLX55398.1 MAG: tyrosine recombinase XerC [Chromatiales bacterium]
MADEFRAWIEKYLAHLGSERRLSRHTVVNYRRDLTALIAFCDKQDVSAWRQLDSFHIRQFAAADNRAGLAPRSIQRRLSAVRSFFRYLIREGLLDANPAADVPAPRGPKRLPKTLDADQMGRLLELPQTDPLAVRDWAMMELLYSSGLRLAELVGLDIGAVDLADGTVRVTGKGNKTRVVPVGSHARTAIAKWLKQRGHLTRPNTDQALFLGARGNRISARSVQSRVQLWARRQGLAQSVSPHLFRHSFASHLLESSGDLRGVQELLGHADISSTQVYTHLDFQHLARIYDDSHPRARRRRRSDED